MMVIEPLVHLVKAGPQAEEKNKRLSNILVDKIACKIKMAMQSFLKKTDHFFHLE